MKDSTHHAARCAITLVIVTAKLAGGKADDTVQGLAYHKLAEPQLPAVADHFCQQPFCRRLIAGDHFVHSQAIALPTIKMLLKDGVPCQSFSINQDRDR